MFRERCERPKDARNAAFPKTRFFQRSVPLAFARGVLFVRFFMKGYKPYRQQVLQPVLQPVLHVV